MFKFPARQKAKAPVPYIPPELPWRQIPDWISLYRAGRKYMPPAQAWWNALDWHIDAEAAGYPDSRYPDYAQGCRALEAAIERKQRHERFRHKTAQQLVG